MGRAALALLALAAAGCGVLATEGSGDDNLPDAHLGPFRTFAEGEVQLPPLAVLDFQAALGGPDVVRTDAGGLVLYMHAAPDDDDVTVLRRMTGDVPTAFADPEVVLDGEPAGLRDPAVVDDDATTLLYFGLGTGDEIGVARSADGAPFVRDPDPVLVAEDPVAEPIGAPSVVRVDGQWLLYIARGDSIALAVSDDGATFRDEGIVLSPGEDWDGAGVGDPEAIVTTTPLGETRVRLYYTGRSTLDPPERGVGVAVSLDGHGSFSRFVGNPVIALDGEESAPAVVPGQGDAPALLYFARESGTGRPGIGGATLP